MRRVKSLGNIAFNYNAMFVSEEFSPANKLVETYISAANTRIMYSAELANPPCTLDSKSNSWVTDEQRIAIIASYNADEELDIVFSDDYAAKVKFALESPPTFTELFEGACLYTVTIPMYYIVLPYQMPHFEMRVYSSTMPVVSSTGGSLTVEDNSDGTWQLTGDTGITEVWFDYDTSNGVTLSPNITKIECIRADSLTSLEKFCMGLSSMTDISFTSEFVTSNVVSFGNINGYNGYGSGAWIFCSSLTSFPLIDTSSGMDFSYAWYGCSSLTSFPLINTSSGTNFNSAWYDCSSLTSFPLIDTSSGTNFYSAWYYCSSLTSFPLIDTSSGMDFSYAWYGCSSLTSFPLINTSSGTNFNSAWYDCSSLTSFPLIDTSSGMDFSLAWYYCSSLTSFPLIDTSSGTNFNSAWGNCSSLTSFPLINTSSGTNFIYSWYRCSSLVCLSGVDTRQATNTSNMFYNTTALVRPNATERTDIENGALWVNDSPCP